MLSDILAAHGIGVKFVRGSNLVGDKPEHSLQAITDGSTFSTCRNLIAL